MKISKLLITGASPDQTNRNTVLRAYVVEGFQQLLGEGNVFYCPLELAADITSEIKPDLVLSFGSCMPDDSDYFALRYSCYKNNSILAFWLHDDPYEFDYNYKVCNVADYIFSNDKWASLHYDHDHVYHLPLAASKTYHWKQLNTNKKIDLFFCGVGFPNRISLISDMKKILKKYNTMVLGDQWPDKLYPLAKNKRLTNAELSDFYAKSKITINIGRDFNYANNRYDLVPSTPGPRTFEAAMAGTVQAYFVDGLEIEEYFTPRKEIILFDSPQEIEEIMQECINEKLDTFSIQESAQSRTLREHTYFSRAKKLLGIIEGQRVN